MKPRFFPRFEDFYAWLEANHESKSELLVGFHRRDSGKPSITWPESVDAALCFGWIDGVRRSLGESSYAIRFTPRRRGSTWSLVNCKKMQALLARKLVRAAGLRAFEARMEKKTGTYSFERSEPARLEPAQEKKLRANARAWRFFSTQPPWYQRSALHWVVSAQREATRERRLDTLIEDSTAGRTIRLLTRRQ